MDPRTENQITASETIRANVPVFIHKQQEGGDNDPPVPNMPHVPDAWTLLREEPAPDFACRGALPSPTFWWRANSLLLSIAGLLH